FPAIVVVIDQPGSPAGMQDAGARHSCLPGNIIEGSSRPVLEESVALRSESVHEDIGPAVVVVIRKIDTHAGEGLTILIESHPHLARDFAEGAVATIAKELLRKGIVGDDDVRPAIAVKVIDRYAKPF